MIIKRLIVRRARAAFAVAFAICAFALMYDTVTLTSTRGVTAGARRAQAGAFASFVGFIACSAYVRSADRALGVSPSSSASFGQQGQKYAGPGAEAPEGATMGRGGRFGLAGDGAPPRRTWNGSAWVERKEEPRSSPAASSTSTAKTPAMDEVQGTGSFGYGGYQDGVEYEDARARAEAERAEQEKWARWEAEDEEREARRAEKRAEKKAEDKAKKEKSRAKRWAKYDERWEALEASASVSEPLRYDDVPWPPKIKDLLNHEAGGADATDRERTLAYHRCVKRWHPDKFLTKFRDRLVLGGEFDRVSERAHAVAKALTAARAAA
jgi:hypothetical protein